MDVSLIVNEVIDSRLKTNKGRVISKLFIKKVYDDVSWSFIFAILEKMSSS